MKYAYTAPPMPPLNPPRHFQQQHIGYCLPTCVQMAFSQFGLDVQQADLAKQLDTVDGLGTPFPNIARLSSQNIIVETTEWSGLAAIDTALRNDHAVIAAILTSADLPGWSTAQTQHTFLITDIQINQVYYHDPSLSTGPVTVSLNAFLLAWSDMEELAATLRYTP